MRLLDAIRPLSDPVAVQETACRLLGEQLGAARVQYVEIADDTVAEVKRDWVHGVRSIAGTFPVAAYGAPLLSILRRGGTYVIDDVDHEPQLSPELRIAFGDLDIGATIATSLVKGGVWLAVLTVHADRPRAWSSEEVVLVEEVAERTWAAVERTRAEAALRASDERYRALFEAIDEGFCIIEMIFDENDAPVDYRFVRINPAFAAHTGLVDAEGKRIRDIEPNHEDHWFEIYGRIAKTGVPERFLNRAVYLDDRWFDVYAFPAPGTEPNRVAILFRDVSERVRAEQALRDMADSLEQRVEERTRELRRKERRIRELASRLTDAEHQERQRIAEVLHDDVQQVLHAVEMKLGAVQAQLVEADHPDLAAIVREARMWIDSGIKTTRRLSVDLRPVILKQESLHDVLEWLSGYMHELHGLAVELDAPQPVLVPDEVLRVQLFAIARELLFNVRKHSGVDRARVELFQDGDHVVMRVTDRGCGFEAREDLATRDPATGLGLVSIRERVHLWGGRFEITSANGEGVFAEVRVPLELGRPSR